MNKHMKEYTLYELVNHGFENPSKAKKCHYCKSKSKIIRKRIHISPDSKGYQCLFCFIEMNPTYATHILKISIPYFEKIVTGQMTSQVILKSLECVIGDTIEFHEHDAIENTFTGNILTTSITGIQDIDHELSIDDIWEYGINLIEFGREATNSIEMETKIIYHICKENMSGNTIASGIIYEGRSIKNQVWQIIEQVTNKILLTNIAGCPFCLNVLEDFNKNN